MAFDTNGMFRDNNLIGNYPKMLWAIADYIESNAVAAELGIKVIGEAENVSDIPEGEYSYGDAYMIGTEAPYEMYIWTRANGNHPEDYWFNVGHFPMPGPQGETGIGIDDVVSEMLAAYQNSSAEYNFANGFYDVQINGTKTTTLDNNTTIETPVELNIPIQTDGQIVVETGHSNNADIDTVKIKLDKNLNDTYLQKTYNDTARTGQPQVYGGYKSGITKISGLRNLPIKFDNDNVIMYAGTGDSSDENGFSGTGSACHWNTILGKGNYFYGTGEEEYATTENLCFGGKNQIHAAVQDSATFGYRNEVYANQAFTAGYKNYNYGSESIIIGSQNTLAGSISIDTTGPDYDGASSNTKQCAVFGYKNTLGTSNQQMLVAGDQNTIGNNSKWGFVAGSHQNIGKDNFCVNAIDYGNTTERYIEDCTLIGYYNHIYGGPDGSNKVYGVNMIGHDNNNLDSGGNHCSEVSMLGNNLTATGNNCVVLGSWNAGDMDEAFARLVVGTGASGAPATTIKVFNGETDFTGIIKIGNTSLSESQLQSLLALI